MSGSPPLTPRLDTWFLVGEGETSATIRHIPITCSPFSVGRRRDADLCLPVPSVSKDHANLFCADGAWRVRDLKSTNGTFLNGKRVEGVEPLAKNDVLHFANQEFRVGCTTLSGDIAARREEPNPWIFAACQFDRLFDDGVAVPYFQPIVSLTGGGLLGYEVLGRSLLDGLNTPAEMFGIAARLKQEGELSRLFRTLGVTTGLTLPGTPNLFLNTHPFELSDPKLLVSLRNLRQEAPTQPITLEVHESAVTSPEAMKTLRAAMLELNVQLAYDDFGAGQDRLLDLSEVPPDYLKFDARLIRDIHLASPSRQQMVSVLVKLVRDLKIAPLAEGVETREESEACQALGFEFGQGFYYGRPAPVTEHLARTGDLADWGLAKKP